jgi:uncharacterized protein YwgA
MATKPELERAVGVVRAAGGRVVGRTRLQKVAYLLQLAGFGRAFDFEYHHYGPYSDDLADALRTARAFGLVSEEEHVANWGGTYSIFVAPITGQEDPEESAFATAAAKIGPIELELAATAAYLSAVEKHPDPWAEAERLKPEKAKDGRLASARRAYQDLLRLRTPKDLPQIA